MNRRLVSTLAVMSLVAACHHHNNPETTYYPGSASNSSVDGRRGGPGRGEEMLFRGITLNSDQQQRVDAIRARYRSQMDEMREQSNGDRTAMRDRMRVAMDRQVVEIRAVLNEDQQRQFDQNVAEMRARQDRNR